MPRLFWGDRRHLLVVGEFVYPSFFEFESFPVVGEENA
jgi:hypothetical protein